MSVKLHKASLNDIPAIFSLAFEIWNKHYVEMIGQEQVDYMLAKMYSEQSLTEQMQEKNHTFYLVKNDGVDIGFISISSDNAKNFQLHKFYILNTLQNKGLGTEVFRLIFNEMNDPNTVQLTVNRQNYKSVNFYFKNSFKIIEVADFEIGNNYYMNDFVMMWKK